MYNSYSRKEFTLTSRALEDPTTKQSFDVFCTTYHLTEQQIEQFRLYTDFLLKNNEDFNLTAIKNPLDIIKRHFEDSLMLSKALDCSAIKGLADIGSGGGFPGIPLKILYPTLNLVLIEVSHKKAKFLQEIIELLGLSSSEVCSLDWRTFLRKTTLDIDTFIARASLEVSELIRVFKPSSPYKNSKLIYWASCYWKPSVYEKPVID